MKTKEIFKKSNRLMALVLATALVMGTTGCTNGVRSYRDSLVGVEVVNDFDDEDLADVTRLSSDVLNEYLLYYSTIEMGYDNKDLYLPWQQVIDVIEASKTYKECHHLYHDDAVSLLDKITNNSRNYVKQSDKYLLAFTNEAEKLGNENVAVLSALKIFLDNASNDVLEDVCQMQDLKIVYDNPNTNVLETDEKIISDGSLVLARYLPDENLIVVDDENIKKVAAFSNVTVLEKTIEVLSHELNHVRQQACDCRIKQGQGYENFNYDDNVSSIMEASAESELYNLKSGSFEVKDTGQYSYADERMYEARLLLLGLCHDNVTIKDYYNAIYDGDLKALYRFFGAEKDADVYNLYNIIYSVDSILMRNNYVYNHYHKDVISLQDAQRIVGHDYVANIFSRTLYNMVNYTGTHDDFTLEENMLLLNIVKNVVVEALYDKEYQNTDNGYITDFVYDDELVSRVFEEEEKYVSFLSDYYKISVQEIREIEKTFQKSISCYDETTYEKLHKKVLKKFPLLGAIEAANPVTGYEYDVFLSKNKLTLAYQK